MAWRQSLPRLVRDAALEIEEDASSLTVHHPSRASISAPTSSPALTPSATSLSPLPAKSFVVTFSQKSEDLHVVQKIVECLETLGVTREGIFYQPDISLTDQESHWISQWMCAQRHSKVVVCLLTSAYLESKPCCQEWKLVQDWQRLVVAVDPPTKLLKTELLGFNGPPLAYVQCAEQMLDARSLTSQQIAEKIMEKYALNKEKSHAHELRRGSSENEPSMLDSEPISRSSFSSSSDRRSSLRTSKFSFSSTRELKGDDTPSANESPTFEPDSRSSLSSACSSPDRRSSLMKTPPLKFLFAPSRESTKGEETPRANEPATSSLDQEPFSRSLTGASSRSSMMKTPPLKFLLSSSNRESEGEGTPRTKAAKKTSKEPDPYRLTPSRASKDRGWFG